MKKTRKFWTKNTTISTILLVSIVVGIVVLGQQQQGFGRQIIENINKNACTRTENLNGSKNTSDKTCFDLTGSVYIVSTNQTEKIVKQLFSIVEDRQLNQNKDFNRYLEGGSDRIVQAITNPKSKEWQSAYEKDPRYSGVNIGYIFSGGLFGEYSFPVGDRGALYVSVFVGEEGGTDDTYIIRSEFGATKEQAEKIAATAKSLKKDEYLLFVAQ
jgi:hypothetical protein